MKILASLLLGSLSVRVTRNLLRHQRRQRRLRYLPR
jgi:hypothetical protein